MLGICSLVAVRAVPRHPGDDPSDVRPSARSGSPRDGSAATGLATAGFVTGLIGTIWSVLGVILLILLFAFGAAWFDENCTTTTDADGTSSIDCSNT